MDRIAGAMMSLAAGVFALAASVSNQDGSELCALAAVGLLAWG